MYFSDRTDKSSVAKNHNHICPKCSFDNHTAAIYCEICFYPLNVSTYTPKKSSSPKPQPTKAHNQTTANIKQELQKPSVISGLLVLALAIALWVNYFISRRPTYLASPLGDKIALYDSMNQVRNVPEGLFSYGGALYFASLVAHGINDAMMQSHPNFNLRYTKPRNQDQSYANGIQMLLDGELSFAFNGRSLTDAEYSQAKLRSVDLQQIPIAIDGIVFFGNNNIAVNNLSLDQVKDIFTGKITNWNQLGGENRRITPVLLTPENLEILGFQDVPPLPPSTNYVANYTLALRKVIATPGAISFASASLVKDQQAIKVFGLAESNSVNYVAPFVAGKTNLELFRNGSYPLTRRLFVVIRRDGTPDQLAGKAYTQMLLSNQGQKIVESAGFVPLYGEK
ncbi:MAG: substrate-binding domain-containing protein [Cyanobacteria bacterium P01_G01_bin.67]